MYVQNLPVAHVFSMAYRLFCIFCRLFLTSYGVSYFLIPHSLWLAPFGAGFCLIVSFSSFSQFFLLFSAVLHFLRHYSIIPAMVLFDPSLLGFFGPATYSSLNDSVWSLGFLLCCLWAPMSYFLLGILDPF